MVILISLLDASSTSLNLNVTDSMPETPPFRIAITADFYDDAGAPQYEDFGLDTFAGQDHIEVSRFSEHREEIGADQLAGHHAALVLTPRVTANSLAAMICWRSVDSVWVTTRWTSTPARRNVCL